MNKLDKKLSDALKAQKKEPDKHPSVNDIVQEHLNTQPHPEIEGWWTFKGDQDEAEDCLEPE